MSRIVLIVTAALAGAGAGAMPANAAPADTHIEFETIEYSVPDGETRYGGKIFSDRRKCLLDRKVVVYRKRSGKDEKIGKGEANEDKPNMFGWSVFSPGQAKSGKYYAKAPAVDGCNADKSNTYDYVLGMPRAGR